MKSDLNKLCTKVKQGWYPKTAKQWREFWLTYVKMLHTDDPRLYDVHEPPGS